MSIRIMAETVNADKETVRKIEWIPESQTVNQTYYLKVLATLKSEFVGNSQSYGKTSYGSSPRTMHPPIMRCL